MKISEGQKARMRELDNKLLASIKSHTNLDIREIRDLEMEKLEKRLELNPLSPGFIFRGKILRKRAGKVQKNLLTRIN
jgi:hypothetical protein